MKRAVFLPGIVLATAVSLVLPPQVVWANSSAQPSAHAVTEKVKQIDVELNSAGMLQGIAVDAQGAALADVPVVMLQHGKAVASVKSDKSGKFEVPGLKGGVYQIATNGSSAVLRLWSQDTAPPAAGKTVLLVPQSTVVRGQQPIGDIFKSDAFIVGAILATAIAIPIIVHNNRDSRGDDSSS